MATARSLLVAIVLLAAASAVFADDGPSDVVTLTPDNVEQYLGQDEAAFVKFYAPWCGHCKKLAPDYEKFGTAFKKTKSVNIAKVDCDVHKDICNKYDVKGFPTLKWFPAKSSSGEPYQGGRELDDLIGFVNGKLGTNVKVAAAPSDVVVLTPENFDSFVLDKTKGALVEFYAPWCGHCKNLAPVYDRLGTAFKAEANVVIGKVDADAHKSLGERFGVSGYPTIKWFPADNKAGVDYNEGRSLEDFVKFINKEVGTKRTAAGTLNEAAGKIEALDALAAKFISASAAERESLKKFAEEEEKKVSAEASKQAAYYLKVIKNIEDKGVDYVGKEVARLNRMLSGALKTEKLDDFTIRINILASFLPSIDDDDVVVQ